MLKDRWSVFACQCTFFIGKQGLSMRFGKGSGAAGNRSAPRSIFRRGRCDFQGDSISGLFIDIPYPDQILDFVFTRNNFTQPSCRFIFIIQIPADDGNICGLGDMPESGFDGRHLFACSLRHDGQKKLVSRFEKLHHLFHNALGCTTIDRDASDGFEKKRNGPEEPFFFYHDMAGSPDNPIARESSDRIHVGSMGKTDNHVLAGKIGRKRLKMPAHQEIDGPSHKTHYLFHKRFLPKDAWPFLCKGGRFISARFFFGELTGHSGRETPSGFRVDRPICEFQSFDSLKMPYIICDECHVVGKGTGCYD